MACVQGKPDARIGATQNSGVTGRSAQADGGQGRERSIDPVLEVNCDFDNVFFHHGVARFFRIRRQVPPMQLRRFVRRIPYPTRGLNADVHQRTGFISFPAAATKFVPRAGKQATAGMQTRTDARKRLAAHPSLSFAPKSPTEL
jgi:hypothetical protein